MLNLHISQSTCLKMYSAASPSLVLVSDVFTNSLHFVAFPSMRSLCRASILTFFQRQIHGIIPLFPTRVCVQCSAMQGYTRSSWKAPHLVTPGQPAWPHPGLFLLFSLCTLHTMLLIHKTPTTISIPLVTRALPVFDVSSSPFPPASRPFSRKSTWAFWEMWISLSFPYKVFLCPPACAALRSACPFRLYHIHIFPVLIVKQDLVLCFN